MEQDIYRWGIAFLTADSRLTEEQRIYLVNKAVSMYFQDEETSDVHINLKDRDDLCLEGRIITRGETGVIESFVGIIYTAEVDIAKGRVKVSFLLSEQTGRIFGEI